MSVMTWGYALIIHHNFLGNSPSSVKDCDVAALSSPDMMVVWQALWIVSSGLLCWDARFSWAELQCICRC